jgi:hypothetical protein
MPNRLERVAEATGHAVGLVVRAAKLAVVVEVGGHPVVELDGETGAEQGAVAAELWAVDEEGVPRAIGEVGVERVSGVAVLVLPR